MRVRGVRGGRSAPGPGAPGFTLLEVLVALVVLFIGLVPLIQAFRGGFKATLMGREHSQAMVLADSVMEEVRARVSLALGRYYRIYDDAKSIQDRAAAGVWKAVFSPLAEDRKRVVSSDPSRISTYFARVVDLKGGSCGPLSAEADPIGFAQLAAFTTKVDVNFEVDGAPIDSDGDKKPETDMCEVAVTVYWSEGSPAVEKSYRLASLFSLDDFSRTLGEP